MNFSSGPDSDEVSGLMRSESTVVYHISHAVEMGHAIGKEFVKLIRSTVIIPEIVFSHFTLYLVMFESFLLAFDTIP